MKSMSCGGKEGLLRRKAHCIYEKWHGEVNDPSASTRILQSQSAVGIFIRSM